MPPPLYTPAPLDTSNIVLADHITELTERLAENAHDLWAQERLRQGWHFGEKRDDAQKEHPCLVPYDVLPDSEKEFDRKTAVGSLKAILALGYRIDPSGTAFTVGGTQAMAAWHNYLEHEATSARSHGPREWTFDMDDAPEIEWLKKAGIQQAHDALAELRRVIYPLWKTEDATALAKQKWHHRTAALAIWPGIAGILFAIVQLTNPPGMAVFGLLETLSVLIAGCAVIGGIYFHLHHGWLAHRQRAERLRILKFSALSWPELWCDFDAWKQRLQTETETLSKITTQTAHHWAKEKDSVRPELPEAPACVVPLADLQALSILYRIKRLEFQRHYFEHQSGKAHSRSRIVDNKLGLWIFATSVVIVLLHGIHHWMNAGEHGEGHHGMSSIEITAIALAAMLPVIGFGFRAWLAAFEAPRSRNLFRAKALALDDYIARTNASFANVKHTLHHISHGEHFFINEHREWCRLQMEAEWFV